MSFSAWREVVLCNVLRSRHRVSWLKGRVWWWWWWWSPASSNMLLTMRSTYSLLVGGASGAAAASPFRTAVLQQATCALLSANQDFTRPALMSLLWSPADTSAGSFSVAGWRVCLPLPVRVLADMCFVVVDVVFRGEGGGGGKGL